MPYLTVGNARSIMRPVNRPKEYDRQEALTAAMTLFWGKGYQGTSMNELVEVTGVHRRSMYDDFGDKESLFLACIDQYLSEAGAAMDAMLRREPICLKNIETFLVNRAEYASSRNFRGCLLVNTVNEEEHVSQKVRRKVVRHLASHERVFFDCLAAAQRQGEIPKSKDCKVQARFLMCFLEGLMVMGRTKPAKESLMPLVQTVLSAISR